MTRDVILGIFKNYGSVTEVQIRNITGLGYDQVRKALIRMQRAGIVRLDADGTYQLVGATLGRPAVALKPPRKLVNDVILLLDDSGSMAHISDEAQTAINKTIRDAQENEDKFGQETNISLYLFGSGIPRRLYYRMSARRVQLITGYEPRQAHTRLFDAVGTGINEHLSIAPSADEDHSFLLIVVTDGGDNDSQLYDDRTLNTLIRSVQATDHWTLTFQLPPDKKDEFCSRFSIPRGNVVEWDQTREGVREGTVLRTSGLNAFYSQRAAGRSSIDSFYVTTDLSKLKTTDLKRKLVDIRTEVKLWKVEREEEISDFVRRHTKRPYVAGTAFYQLTKTEKKVQPNKKILVMEKGKDAVYSGAAARQLLGLPVGANCKIVPGNHSKFDPFIQSKSQNRKVVRGTTVIYHPHPEAL